MVLGILMGMTLLIHYLSSWAARTSLLEDRGHESSSLSSVSSSLPSEDASVVLVGLAWAGAAVGFGTDGAELAGGTAWADPDAALGVGLPGTSLSPDS